MRFAEKFDDYELIDASDGEKLERWGNIYLIRPEPQAIWKTEKRGLWEKANAVYHRSAQGGGYWEKLKKVPEVWSVSYKDLTFNLKPMGFKHTGLFPEQAVNWDFIKEHTKKDERILNLFAYTGGATVAALSCGAAVTHVDASKGMTAWAKENAKASGLIDKNVRWLVDDCVKFVKREIRRGNKYDGIILDPPSYGRGPTGEVWKLEEQLYDLLVLIKELLSDDASYIILNTYTAGISSSILSFMVKEYAVSKSLNGRVTTDEIGVPVTEKNVVLPCGNTTIWISDKFGKID